MNIFLVMMSIIIGGTSAFAFYNRRRIEEKLEYESIKRGRKTCLMEPLMLPLCLLVITVTLLILGGVDALSIIPGKLVQLFLHISVYYALLLLLLPLLRRVISALACGMLWLVPTLLYFSIYISGHEIRPLYVITLPRRYLPIISAVWACGFAAVMLWQLISHLSFRRFLLRNAEHFRDTNAVSIWRNEAKRHGIRAEIPILVSDAVSTPLTIGCFERSMRLVLPMRSYSPDELSMIFRHELRHILRCDTRTKLFLSFCAAMCWFNPLAWLARRKVADDLELSCDEAILSGTFEDERRRYADLLLKSAGDGRGCTTCLSAAAGTLRYRLRNIVRPTKRLSGGVFIGIAMFALIATFGAVGLADDAETVQTLIFDKAPPYIVIDRVSVDNWSGEAYGYRSVYGYDEAALTDYIASLRVRQVYAGNYEEDASRQFYVDYREVVDGKTVSLTRFELCSGLIFANIPYDDSGEITYILDDEIDWEYLNSLLDFDVPDPDPSPHPPDMYVYFTQVQDVENMPKGPLTAAKRVISVTDADGLWVAEYSEKKTELRLVDPDTQVDTTRYLFDSLAGIGGVFGSALNEVRLEFSYPAEHYSVTVENWDRTERYTVEVAQTLDGILSLAPYSAHYTVFGSFDTVRDTHYEMVFYFDIGLPVDAELWEKN